VITQYLMQLENPFKNSGYTPECFGKVMTKHYNTETYTHWN